MVRITGTVGSSGKQLVTSMPVASQAHIPLKITFESNTGGGTSLTLWAGSVADFEKGNAGTALSGSGGPGFTFLTIIDAADLNGQMLYVQREAGSGNSLFTINIE
jgi:hypothetical protein